MKKLMLIFLLFLTIPLYGESQDSSTVRSTWNSNGKPIRQRMIGGTDVDVVDTDSTITISTTGSNTVEPIPIPQSLVTMYQRNVKQIITLAENAGFYDSSTFSASGTHSHNTTIYKVDTVSIGITGTGNLHGINNPSFSAKDLTHFPNGDTSTTANYITFALYIDNTSLTNLASAGFAWEFGNYTWPTGRAVGTIKSSTVAKAALAAGWNFIAQAKSAYGESADWTGMKNFTFHLNAAPSGSVTALLSNFQMIRKDSIDTRPNPFWPAGQLRWNETATAGLTIYDGGPADDTVAIQSMVSGDYLTSTAPPADSFYGRVIVSQTDSTRAATLGGDSLRVKARSGNKILLLATGGISDSVNYAYAARDTLIFNLIFDGDSTYRLKLHVNGDADSTLTAYTTAAPFNMTLLKLTNNDRLLDLPELLSNLWYIVIGGRRYYNTADSTQAN